MTASAGSSGKNFGETQGGTTTTGGTITGTVYNDLNGNGTQDSGETGLAGWQVFVDVNGSGSYVSGDPTATTDANGTYTFSGVPAGSYTIGIVSQSGFSTVEGSSEWDVNVTAGQSVDGGSFGETQASGSISGTVYNVASNSPIYNWAVYVDLNDSGSYVDGDPYYVTGSNGAYNLTGLAPGTYVIRAAVYPNLPWAAAAGSGGYTVTVVANQNVFGGNFGERFL